MQPVLRALLFKCGRPSRGRKVVTTKDPEKRRSAPPFATAPCRTSGMGQAVESFRIDVTNGIFVGFGQA